jgi:hypothetical protein
MGLIYYKSDLLLKLMSQGYEDSGRGIPNEFELSVYQAKKGISHSPSVLSVISSFNEFFKPVALTATGHGLVQRPHALEGFRTSVEADVSVVELVARIVRRFNPEEGGTPAEALRSFMSFMSVLEDLLGEEEGGTTFTEGQAAV